MKHLCHLFMFSIALIVGTSPAQGGPALTTTLLGSNETPPNASTATGNAVVALESGNNTLDVVESFVGLIGGPASAAHIHCCASPGVAAMVAVPFPNFPAATSGTYANTFDLSVAGTYTAAFITANGGTVDSAKAAFITGLKTGQTYVNIHNATFPGGEIRGQLLPTNTHDFNVDGKSDIAWRDGPSGTVASWLMNSFQVRQSGTYGAVGNNWQIVGQRDFDGDGRADLLWRDSQTGTPAIWLLNGLQVMQTGGFSPVDNNWVVAGTGDFNGDGKGDIVWFHNPTGTVAVWLLNGFSTPQTGILGIVPSGWAIAGTGDFNGDGMTDILWYHAASGTVAIWLLNGASVLQTGTVGVLEAAVGPSSARATSTATARATYSGITLRAAPWVLGCSMV